MPTIKPQDWIAGEAGTGAGPAEAPSREVFSSSLSFPAWKMRTLPFLLFQAWHLSTTPTSPFPAGRAAVLSRVLPVQDFRANERGQSPPSRARLGEEVWTARENRQKHTYKAADLQINGAPSRAASLSRVLKECTAVGDQLLCGSSLACLWPRSRYPLWQEHWGLESGPPASIRQRWKETLCTPIVLVTKTKRSLRCEESDLHLCRKHLPTPHLKLLFYQLGSWVQRQGWAAHRLNPSVQRQVSV